MKFFPLYFRLFALVDWAVFLLLPTLVGVVWFLRWRFWVKLNSYRISLFMRQDGTGQGIGSGIHFVSGVPGGGKSLWVHCYYICAELKFGKRIVATNFKFGRKLGAMRDWMARNGIPDYRLQILEDNNIRNFYFTRWHYGKRSGRTATYKLQDMSRSEWTQGKIPQWRCKGGDVGIVFVLEECANLFRSKEHMNFPESATFYLSQHRKFNDAVIVLTQDVDLITLDFRRLAQDFTYLRNYNQSTFRGISLGNRFEARTYNSPQSRGFKSGVPIAVKVFSLDKDLASLYDTDAGVGVTGNGADKGWRPTGIPIGFVFVAAIFIVVGLIWCVTRGTGFLAQKCIARGNEGASAIRQAALHVGDSSNVFSTALSSPSSPNSRPVFSRPVSIVGFSAGVPVVVAW